MALQSLSTGCVKDGHSECRLPWLFATIWFSVTLHNDTNAFFMIMTAVRGQVAGRCIGRFCFDTWSVTLVSEYTDTVCLASVFRQIIFGCNFEVAFCCSAFVFLCIYKCPWLASMHFRKFVAWLCFDDSKYPFGRFYICCYSLFNESPAVRVRPNMAAAVVDLIAGMLGPYVDFR